MAAKSHPLTDLPAKGEISTVHFFPEHPTKAVPAGDKVGAPPPPCGPLSTARSPRSSPPLRADQGGAGHPQRWRRGLQHLRRHGLPQLALRLLHVHPKLHPAGECPSMARPPPGLQRPGGDGRASLRRHPPCRRCRAAPASAGASAASAGPSIPQPIAHRASAQLYFEIVKPGEEVSVEYMFTPNPLLTPTEFTVALTVFYEDLKGAPRLPPALCLALPAALLLLSCCLRSDTVVQGAALKGARQRRPRAHIQPLCQPAPAAPAAPPSPAAPPRPPRRRLLLQHLLQLHHRHRGEAQAGGHRPHLHAPHPGRHLQRHR